MGADLLGYLLTGPTTLSAASLGEAEMQVQTVLEQQKELIKRFDNAGEDLDVVVDLVLHELEHVPRLSKGIGTALERSQWDDDIVLFVEESLIGSCSDAEEFIDRVVAAWRGDYRDTVSRSFIDPMTGQDDLDFQFLFSGDNSWGDGPHEDSAWWIFDRASWFDLFRVLHIH